MGLEGRYVVIVQKTLDCDMEISRPLRARPEGGSTWSRVQKTPQQVGFKRTEPIPTIASSYPKRRCSTPINLGRESNLSAPLPKLKAWNRRTG